MLPPVLSPKRSSSSVVLGSPSSPLPAIPSAALLTPRSAEMQEMRVLSIGICIDYFTITGLAGDGSNGVVFSATCKVPDHPFPGKPYALKAMYVYGGSTSKNTSKERFEVEFKLLARLRPHPRIVRLWTIFRDAVPPSALALLPRDTVELLLTDDYGDRRSEVRSQFAVFDLHPSNMKEHRRAGPPILPWPALREFGLQLSEGCMYLAANNIIHGDMKLDNLLMKEDGSLCIADNGEALQLPDDSREITLATSQLPGGNAAHRAPEVVQAFSSFSRPGVLSASVDFSKQDVFELGVLLAELAFRKHPLDGYPASFTRFGTSSVTYTAEDICAGIRVRDADYPPGFLPLVKRMLACDPADRPSLSEAAAAFTALTLHGGCEHEPELVRLRSQVSSLTATNARLSQVNARLTSDSGLLASRSAQLAAENTRLSEQLARVLPEYTRLLEEVARLSEGSASVPSSASPSASGSEVTDAMSVETSCLSESQRIREAGQTTTLAREDVDALIRLGSDSLSNPITAAAFCATVEAVCHAVDDNCTMLGEPALTAVLAAMDAHPSDASVQSSGCSALYSLNAVQQNCQKSVSVGAIHRISQAWNCLAVDETGLVTAVRAIEQLVSQESVHSILSVGWLDRILTLMGEHQSVDVQRVCCRVLQRLTTFPAGKAAALSDSRTMQYLERANELYPDDEDVLECADSVLNDLGRLTVVLKSCERFGEIGKNNRLSDARAQALVDIAVYCDVSLIAAAFCAAVASVCINVSENRVILGKLKSQTIFPSCSVQRLVYSAMDAHPADVNVQSSGCAALWRLCTSDEYGVHYSDVDCIVGTVACIGRAWGAIGNYRVGKRNAVGAIGVLSSSDSIVSILDAGWLNNILEFMEENHSGEEDQAVCCEALAKLTSHAVGKEAVLADRRSIPLIQRARGVHSSSVIVQEYAKSALLSLGDTATVISEYQRLCASGRAAPYLSFADSATLIRLGSHCTTDAQIASAFCETISMICKGVVWNCERLGEDAIDVIIAAMDAHRTDVVVQSHGVEALRCINVTASNRAASVSSGVIDRISRAWAVLPSETDSGKVAAVAVTGSLLSTDSVQSILDAGWLDRILAFMEEQQANSRHVGVCCEALSRFTSQPLGKAAVVMDGRSVPYLQQVRESNIGDEVVQRSARLALDALIDRPAAAECKAIGETWKNRHFSRADVDTLLRLGSESTSSILVVSAFCDAVASVCKNIQHNRTMLGERAVTAIISAMDAHPGEVSVQTSALAALGFVITSADVATAAVSAISRAWSAFEGDARGKCAAIGAITSLLTAESVQFILDAGWLGRIFDLMDELQSDHQDDDLLLTCCRALEALVLIPAGKSALVADARSVSHLHAALCSSDARYDWIVDTVELILDALCDPTAVVAITRCKQVSVNQLLSAGDVDAVRADVVSNPQVAVALCKAVTEVCNYKRTNVEVEVQTVLAAMDAHPTDVGVQCAGLTALCEAEGLPDSLVAAAVESVNRAWDVLTPKGLLAGQAKAISAICGLTTTASVPTIVECGWVDRILTFLEDHFEAEETCFTVWADAIGALAKQPVGKTALLADARTIPYIERVRFDIYDYVPLGEALNILDEPLAVTVCKRIASDSRASALTPEDAASLLQIGLSCASDAATAATYCETIHAICVAERAIPQVGEPAITAVIAALDANPFDDNVQSRGCNALSCLVSNVEAHADFAVASGALVSVGRAWDLLIDSDEGPGPPIRAIGSLTTSNTIHAILHAGWLDRALPDPSHSYPYSFSCIALARFAVHPEGKAAVLDDDRAVPFLQQCASSDDDDLRTCARQVLFTLGDPSSIVSECERIGAAGQDSSLSRADADLLIQIGTTAISDAHIAVAFCSAVEKACRRNNNRALLGEPVITAVIAAMDAFLNDARLQSIGCVALWNVNSDVEANSRFSVTSGALSRIDRAWSVVGDDPRGKASAIGALGMLTSVSSIPAILDAGWLDRVLVILGDGEEDQDLCFACCLALSEFAKHSIGRAALRSDARSILYLEHARDSRLSSYEVEEYAKLTLDALNLGDIPAVTECRRIRTAGEPAPLLRADVNTLIRFGTDSRADPVIAAAFCDAVGNVCRTVPENRAMLGQPAIAAVIAAMDAHAVDVNVQSNGCLAVSNLTLDDERLQRSCIALGALDRINQAWGVLQDDTRGKYLSISAVSALTTSDTVQSVLEAGWLNRVLTFMQEQRVGDAVNAVQYSCCHMLWLLALQESGHAAMLADARSIPYLQQARDNHPDDEDVQDCAQHALQALGERTAVLREFQRISEAGKERIVSRSDANVFLRLGATFASDSLIAAAFCVTVETLCGAVDDNCTILGERSVTVVLAAMDEHPSDASVQSCACAALWNVNLRAECLQKRSLAAGAVSRIHRAWSVMGARGKCYAVGAIGVLITPDSMQPILYLGWLDRVLTLMDEHREDAECQFVCCWTMSAIVAQSVGKAVLLADSRSVLYLQRAQSSHVSRSCVRSYAGRALWMLGVPSAVLAECERIRDEGSLQSLSHTDADTLLRLGTEFVSNVQIVAAFCAGVAAMCEAVPGNCGALGQPAITAIIAAMDAHPTEMVVQCHGCLALCNLIIDNDAYKRYSIDAGVLARINRAWSVIVSDTRGKHFAISAIGALTTAQSIQSVLEAGWLGRILSFMEEQRVGANVGEFQYTCCRILVLFASHECGAVAMLADARSVPYLQLARDNHSDVEDIQRCVDTALDKLESTE